MVAGKKSKIDSEIFIKIIRKESKNLVYSNVIKVFCIVQTFVLSTKGNKNIME